MQKADTKPNHTLDIVRMGGKVLVGISGELIFIRPHVIHRLGITHRHTMDEMRGDREPTFSYIVASVMLLDSGYYHWI